MVYINKGDHDNPQGLLKDNLEGSLDNIQHTYTHTDILPKMPEEMEKLEYTNTFKITKRYMKPIHK